MVKRKSTVKKFLYAITVFIIVWVVISLSLCAIYFYIINDIPGLVVRNFIIVVSLGFDLFWDVLLVINLGLLGIYGYLKLNKKTEFLSAVKYNLVFWFIFFLLATYVIKFLD